VRVLGAGRLSHDTDASTSIERQREVIELTTKARGGTLVTITEDVDVSGAISPFERADLGPWLTDPAKIMQWDVIMVTKLDRLSRSLLDFANLIKWCQAHGKTIISVAESLDFSTAAGRLMANILAMFAEFERERMSERRTEASAKLRKAGYHDSSEKTAPWGYKPVKVGDHYELEVDPEVQVIALDVAEMIQNGTSANQAGAKYGMTSGVLIRRLRSQTLKGYVVYKDEVVRDENGMPVTREAVIPEDTWNKLQGKLDANGGWTPNRYDRSPYLGVIFHDCGNKLYINRYTDKRGGKEKLREYYTCKVCASRRFPAGEIHAQIEWNAQAGFQGLHTPEVIEHPAEDHTAELEKVQAQIADLDAAFESGAMTAESVGRMLGRLESKRDELAALPQHPAWTEVRDSGRMLLDDWAGADEQGKGDLLRRAGFRAVWTGDMLRLQQADTEDWPATPAA
jgi:site-specific DNA recombinase